MSDRELLELAAKAAGLAWNDYGIDGDGNWWDGKDYLESFDPLADDGDALRLATKLNIDIMFFNGFQEVICGGQGDNDDNITEPYGEDIQAAVRRCIVRAAAEIGRAMP